MILKVNKKTARLLTLNKNEVVPCGENSFLFFRFGTRQKFGVHWFL